MWHVAELAVVLRMWVGFLNNPKTATKYVIGYGKKSENGLMKAENAWHGKAKMLGRPLRKSENV